MSPSLNRPLELKEVTYSTLAPAWHACERIADPLAELRRALDDLEGCVSTERPPAEKIERATLALAELPELLAAFEDAVSPRRMATLRRRVERLREKPAWKPRRRR